MRCFLEGAAFLGLSICEAACVLSDLHLDAESKMFYSYSFVLSMKYFRGGF